LALFVTGSVYLFLGLRTNERAVKDLRVLSTNVRGVNDRHRPVKPGPPVDKAMMLYDVVLPLLVATVLLPLALMSIFWWLLPETFRPQVSGTQSPSFIFSQLYVLAHVWGEKTVRVPQAPIFTGPSAIAARRA